MHTSVSSLFDLQSAAPSSTPTATPTVSAAPTADFSSIKALDDTYIRGGSNRKNIYGIDDIVMVKDDTDTSYYRRGLLKFNIVPKKVIGKKLWLRLYVLDLGKTSHAGITVTQVDNSDWAESEATWDNYRYSKISSSTPALEFSDYDQEEWVSIDVGDILKPYLSTVAAEPRVVVTLLLEKVGKPDSSNFVRFASNDNGDGANGPELSWETIQVSNSVFLECHFMVIDESRMCAYIIYKKRLTRISLFFHTVRGPN